MPSAQHGESGGDQLTAFTVCNLEDIALEAAEFRALHPGIEAAEQGAPGKIIGDDEIVAGGTEQGSDRSIDVAAKPQHADLEPLLGQGLAEEDALDLAVTVIERDDLIAGDEGGTE